MIESEDSMMEMVYEAVPNILSVRWADELSVESARFFQTIVTLFTVIQEKQAANLIISSGKPSGGVLTEDIINHFILNIPHTPLKRIAMLESPDYLWDSNLYQVINLLIVNYQLPIEIEVVKDESAARKWFSQSAKA
ncbi:hypothetical protein K3G39_11480 [Pontibacter sp. HSC-14F20]|uniref:hypothetical protein n=1 Tax=Pontibacter sp. HSC-14F20 TaxID=2864136 RepID=UPI001C732855|nr:hypothetical protein [Pontibacter sp. HSC-14F20]MBX0333857.1 hypothetical protein [Pontibacter sp. HSC-14F20]